MADYIKREDAINKIIDQYGTIASMDALWLLKDTIRRVPAADVREVVHARWVLDSGGIKCSACGDYPEKKDQCYTPYCCLCGAMMDGEG